MLCARPRLPAAAQIIVPGCEVDAVVASVCAPQPALAVLAVAAVVVAAITVLALRRHNQPLT